MNWFKRLLYRPFFIRLFYWEYWSFHVIYFPIYIVWIGLCVLARSFFFFAASNPGFKNGGYLGESKKDIYPLLPGDCSPPTLFFPLTAGFAEVLFQVKKEKLSYPLIGKPDIGSRGRGIKKIPDEDALKSYVSEAILDFHIQEFISYPWEVGIFYYRYPNREKGNISGIVQKHFLSLTGDGKSDMNALIEKNKRAILQKKTLWQLYGEGLNRVLAEKEEFILAPYGNHVRGAMFLDETRLADEALVGRIDSLCKRIPGFYFGRLDIRYRDWEALKTGQDFSLIEVNGAGSEPTHIYDPKHSIFFAWKEIIRHWIILWKISRQNHRRGFPYLTVKQGIAMFREDAKNSAKLAEWKP